MHGRSDKVAKLRGTMAQPSLAPRPDTVTGVANASAERAAEADRQQSVSMSPIGTAGLDKGAPLLSVMETGADGSGRVVTTTAIQRAIDLVAAKGGGTVYFPPGVYLSGGLELRSNITLYLEAGATLLGSGDFADYQMKTKVEEKWFIASGLLNGHNIENVAISGRGTIDGNGFKYKLESMKTWYLRPMNIVFSGCNSVRVSGITLKNSGCWMQLYFQCDNIVVDGITVDNFASENNDAIDIYDSHNVRISNSLFMSDDDGITFKSCTERGSENVVVTNCVVRTHCNAIKFGTESYGGFRNVTIDNCIIKSPPEDRKLGYGYRHGSGALAVECVDGGDVRNINISNIVIDGYEVPIFLRLQDRGRDYGSGKRPIGSMRGIRLSNITASDAGTIGCSITGAPESDITDVSLQSISIHFRGGLAPEAWYGGYPPKPAKAPVPECSNNKYPDPLMYGELPSYAFFIRHVDGLTMRDVQLKHPAPPQSRPAFEIIDVKGLYVDHVDGNPQCGSR